MKLTLENEIPAISCNIKIGNEDFENEYLGCLLFTRPNTGIQKLWFCVQKDRMRDELFWDNIKK